MNGLIDKRMDNYIDKWTDEYIFTNSDQRIVVKINHHWKLNQTLLSHQVTMATVTMEPIYNCHAIVTIRSLWQLLLWKPILHNYTYSKKIMYYYHATSCYCYQLLR